MKGEIKHHTLPRNSGVVSGLSGEGVLASSWDSGIGYMTGEGGQTAESARAMCGRDSGDVGRECHRGECAREGGSGRAGPPGF